MVCLVDCFGVFDWRSDADLIRYLLLFSIDVELMNSLTVEYIFFVFLDLLEYL